MTNTPNSTIPIPSEIGSPNGRRCRPSRKRPGGRAKSPAPEGLNRSENVKNRTQKRVGANAAYASRCATPVGGPWQAKETNIVRSANCFKGKLQIQIHFCGSVWVPCSRTREHAPVVELLQ